MKKFAAAAFAASVILAPAAVQAAPVITVTTTLAPNAFGSPSYAAWVANSIEAQRLGVSTYGTAGSPTQYKAQSNVTAAEAIVTGFNSWLGVADPGSAFGAAFANELGNRMTFGVKIDGNGSQFAIADLSLVMDSTDPDDALDYSFGTGGYTYSDQYVGFLKGDDGILFTDDDVLVTSGANTQLVDGVIGRGSGNSFAAYCTGCTTAQQQAAIDEASWYPGTGFTFTGTYSLVGGASGSGTFNVAAVPEPSSWALMIGGMGLMGFVMRRRSSSTTSVRFA